MRKNKTSIPVNTMTDNLGGDISIEKMFFKDLYALGSEPIANEEAARQSHRHDRHSFFLLESGTVSMEIDFQQYHLMPPAIIYMHPNQVHRMMAFKNVTVYSLAINNENLNPAYLKLLEDITPAKPLVLQKETVDIISEAISLCLQFAERKKDSIYHSLLKDGCNAVVGLIISQYLEQARSTYKLSRFDVINQAFTKLLAINYAILKRPADYAKVLNISIPYLNECVKNVTGQSVSYHIQQRVMLEAKRLLYYSNLSVKEIATELGYDDYPYFSRLFTKTAGISATAFRNKNHD